MVIPAAIIVLRSSHDTALAAPRASSHCYWIYVPFPPWEIWYCPPPTATPTPLPTPPAPSLTVTAPPPNNNVHSISVSWTAIDGAAIYKVAHGPTEGSESTTVETYPPTTSMSVGTGCGVTTYFKVMAYGDGIKYARSWGPWSASDDDTTGACTSTPGPSPTAGATPTPTPTPTPGAPAAPSGLIATLGDGIDLRWTAPGGAVTGYEIQRRVDTSGTKYATIATPEDDRTSYTDLDPSLMEGTSYRYRVRGHNERGSDRLVE